MRLLLLLLSTALAIGCGAPDPEEAALLGHHDGLWSVFEISGDPVPQDRFLIRLRQGRVTGGRDGCNSWGFDETVKPAPDGARMIIAYTQECAPKTEMRAYWRALGNGNVVPKLTKNGDLQLKAGGEEILARRMREKDRFRRAASARP